MSMNSVHEIEQQLKKTLPASYLQYLKQISDTEASPYLETNCGDIALFRLGDQSSYTSLFGKRTLNRRWTTQTWNMLTAYAAMAKRDGYDQIDITGSKSNKPLTWIASRMAIADANGSPVFFDHEDNWSIWVFHQDDYDVELIAKSFSELLLMQGKT